MKIKSRVFNKRYLEQIDKQQRTQIFFGGSSSGKSYFLAQRCVIDVSSKGRNYLICRNTAATIKKSVFNEVVKAIKKFKLSEYFLINKSDLVITCIANQKQILFAGLDDVEKIKSITPISGVITDIWVEEATETEYLAIKQLYKRLRGKSKHIKRMILSFNPILMTHWIYTEYFKNWNDNDNFYEDEELLIMHSTYKDNKFLTADDIKGLEDETDEYFYQVYTLGKWGILGAVIYKNWEMSDLSGIKQYADNIRRGLDFGFADHPSAFVLIHLDTKKKIIYILDEIYVKHCDNEELSELIKPIANNKPVYCDCAEPKSIKELKKYGIYSIATKKGPDSVDFGIKWIQKYKIIIDLKCQNFKNEISQYKWKEDKNGTVLPIPVKKLDDLMDSMRYALENDMIESAAILFP